MAVGPGLANYRSDEPSGHELGDSTEQNSSDLRACEGLLTETPPAPPGVSGIPRQFPPRR
jgi:hypothetical protein